MIKLMKSKSPLLSVLPELTANQFAVSDALPNNLGKMSHGLDADSAVERLNASQKREEDGMPLTYPFHLLSTVHESIDTAFREAFAAQLGSESPDIMRQAQQTARECMAEILSGNEFMRLSPDAIAELDASLREITQHVSREAIKLERAGFKHKGKSIKSAEDMRREIRDKINSQKPVQDFKQRHLGWVATIEKSRESGEQITKPQQ